MISKEEVEKIAGLSRLELTTQETEKTNPWHIFAQPILNPEKKAAVVIT